MISNHSWINRTLSSALLSVALAACAATPTPYQAISDNGGYTETRIESDRYRVKFEGNSATPRETVEDLALYRAAEITLQTGNDYFKVVSKDVEPVISSVRGSGISPGIGIGVGGGSGNVGVGLSTVFGGGGGGRPDYSYVTYLDIIVQKGERPAEDREAYSANDVIQRMGPRVGVGVTVGSPDDSGQDGQGVDGQGD